MSRGCRPRVRPCWRRRLSLPALKGTRNVSESPSRPRRMRRSRSSTFIATPPGRAPMTRRRLPTPSRKWTPMASCSPCSISTSRATFQDGWRPRLAGSSAAPQCLAQSPEGHLIGAALPKPRVGRPSNGWSGVCDEDRLGCSARCCSSMPVLPRMIPGCRLIGTSPLVTMSRSPCISIEARPPIHESAVMVRAARTSMARWEIRPCCARCSSGIPAAHHPPACRDRACARPPPFRRGDLRAAEGLSARPSRHDHPQQPCSRGSP